MRYIFYVIERVIGTSRPEYRDAFGSWCENIRHAEHFNTRDAARFALDGYRMTGGAEMIAYRVAEQELCDY